MSKTIEVATTLDEVRKAVEIFIQNPEQDEEKASTNEYGNGRIQFYFGTFDKKTRHCTIHWDPKKIETHDVSRCINLAVHELVPDLYGHDIQPYYHGA